MTPTFPSLRIHDSCGRVVLRDGLLFCFFMRRSHGDVLEGLWRAVQTYRSAIPSRALAWYAMPDGEWAPLRYPGLDAYNLRPTARSIGTRARGAYWLTFLGPPLLSQLGGTDSLRQRLPSSISLHPMGDERLMVSLGEWPRTGDAATPDDLSPYRALARVLEPSLYQERTPWLVDESFERRWLRRFLED